MSLDIEVRAIESRDVALLELHMPFGGKGKHRERLDRQGKGEVVYFVAWVNGIPVGHVLEKWKGTTDDPMVSQLAGCPDIEDLRVQPDYYRKGIGTLLMDAAESEARGKGFRRIGLGVGLDNTPARFLYDRRDYKTSVFGEYIEGGSYVDESGKTQTWKERCVYLIKELEK